MASAETDIARAFKNAGFWALVAFGLFLPLIGFRAVQDIHNELILETRWPLLFDFVAVVAVGRLLHNLVIAPWRGRGRRGLANRPPAGGPPLGSPVSRARGPLALGFGLGDLA